MYFLPQVQPLARALRSINFSRRRLLASVVATPTSLLAATATERAPLFDGMGSTRADDASPRALARRYVAQGLVLAWGFNPQEAARSFAGALAADPRCAAAAWGIAWALGPTINADLTTADAPRVADALQRALALRRHAAPRWRDLIEALALRHPHADATRVDEAAYEARLRRLPPRHPRDADVALLAAEALLNLHPYDWWRSDGAAQPWTGEITRRLQHALALNPEHPGANHLWVHLLERSPWPQRAQVQTQRLRSLVPGSGHLLHMPAHIDMRLGRYAAASAAGEASIAADLRYLAQVDAQGAYRVGYVAHNHHFLWASAAMQGRSERAIAAAADAWPAACGPRRGDLSSGTLQHFQALPLLALVRFGRWQTLASGTRPPEGDEPYPLLLWHYARGTAFVRLGQLAAARQALQQLQALRADTRLRTLRIKSVHEADALAQIAELTLQADLAAADDQPARALPLLERAVAIEDALEPDEPHLWLAPTRQALGAALLDAGEPRRAARVFGEDLAHYPGNGWSLTGLAQAQRALGLDAAARASQQARAHALRDADLPITRARL